MTKSTEYHSVAVPVALSVWTMCLCRSPGLVHLGCVLLVSTFSGIRILHVVISFFFFFMILVAWVGPYKFKV